MRLALVTDGIHPYVIGGMQKHSFYLAKFLAQMNVEIDLYHFNKSSYDILRLEFFTEDGREKINSILVDFPSNGKLPGHYLRNSIKHSAELFQKFKLQPKVDFIYCKGFTANAFIEAKMKGEQLPPIGVNFHGYEMFQTPPDFKSFLQQKYLLQKPVKKIISQSDYVFSYGGKISPIIESLGVSKSKIVEISAGIDDTWVSDTVFPPNDILKFIFIGRYERRKGIVELNDVLKEISGANNFEFHFVGDIPDIVKLNQTNIFYHGLLSETSKIKNLISSCDVLVAPSHSEGMPNVILEGMACGLAIIATDVGAVSKMVSEKNGLLISPADKIQLTNAIKQFITIDKNILNEMKLSSLSKVKDEFTWNKVGNEIFSFLSKFANKAY
jgi:glycosyltransferase involved in cell wall biosynthesis